MSIIRIRNGGGYGIRLRKVQLDGREIGQLKNGEMLEVKVNKGIHRLTSDGSFGSEAIPLDFKIDDNEEMDIFSVFTRTAGIPKDMFYIEPDIYGNSSIDDKDIQSRKLAWDFDQFVYIRKDKEGNYFDISNLSYPFPLRFHFFTKDGKMKVFANRKSNLVLYESRPMLKPESVKTQGIKLSDPYKQSFYRADGTLLGHLFPYKNSFYISTPNIEEKLAHVELAKLDNNILFNRDHIMLTNESDPKVLATKFWQSYHVFHYQHFGPVKLEYAEILTLAFITLCFFQYEKFISISGFQPPATEKDQYWFDDKHKI